MTYEDKAPYASTPACIRLSMFELRETGDWGIFLGPPERARAETGGPVLRMTNRC